MRLIDHRSPIPGRAVCASLITGLPYPGRRYAPHGSSLLPYPGGLYAPHGPLSHTQEGSMRLMVHTHREAYRVPREAYPPTNSTQGGIWEVYLRIHPQGGTWEACTPLYIPTQGGIWEGFDPVYTHPGRHMGGVYPCIYTPREAYGRGIPCYTHTQGGIWEGYTLLYTPGEAYREAYTPWYTYDGHPEVPYALPTRFTVGQLSALINRLNLSELLTFRSLFPD